MNREMTDSIIYTLVLDNGTAFNVGPVISPSAMQVLEITEEGIGFRVQVKDDYTIVVPYARMVYIGYRSAEK